LSAGCRKGMPRRMDYDTALAFALDEFERRHPRESWPGWLSRCMVWGGQRDAQRRWVMSLTATPNEPLGSNEFCGEVGGEVS
jgi:hypothetical protein